VFREEETAFMAVKKRAKKKQTKSAQATHHKGTPMKKTGKKPAIKRQTLKRHSAKTTAHKKVTVKALGKELKSTRRRPLRRTSQTAQTAAFSPTGPMAGSGGQSGDLQGLSNFEVADSESVDELLEEGNAFEADIVNGVENAGNTNPREVRTHEVPEDDVPDEYLDRE
jgi:hypothetical protein